MGDLEVTSLSPETPAPTPAPTSPPTTITTTLAHITSNMTDGDRIVHDVEAALVNRLNSLMVEYHPWIVGLGVTGLTFFIFVFLCLIFILGMLIWRKRGLKATKGNYNLLRNQHDERDYADTYA